MVMAGIKKRRFASCQLAGAFHPRFKLMCGFRSMTSRLSEGEGCKVVMEEVVEAVLREAADVSPSARDSSSEDVTQIASSRRESSSSKRHMLKTKARKFVGRTCMAVHSL
jgi:hypothetical protein